jgi:rare lipoprotein A
MSSIGRDGSGRELYRIRRCAFPRDLPITRMMPHTLPGPPVPHQARPLARAAACTLALVLALSAGGCAASHDLVRPHEPAQVGLASYYGRAHDGRRTASGEVFDMHAMTAAHRTLPFGTRVRVTNLGNGRRVVVRINDRGPHKRKRIIDLSYGAARELGLVGVGVAQVRVEVVGTS